MDVSSTSGRGPPEKDDQAAHLEPLQGSTLNLLNRAQTGDKEALETLCTRYLPRLYRWATGRLPRRARGIVDTGDLAQETLVKAVHRLGDFEPRHVGAFSAYLRKAILNRIRDEVRKTAIRPELASLDGTEQDPSPSPLEETIGRDLTVRYDKAYLRLKEDDRAAIFLRMELEMNHEEVADALDKPSADAARKAVNRALVRLAEEMSVESR